MCGEVLITVKVKFVDVSAERAVSVFRVEIKSQNVLIFTLHCNTVRIVFKFVLCGFKFMCVIWMLESQDLGGWTILKWILER
jgi:hypothetical protein